MSEDFESWEIFDVCLGTVVSFESILRFAKKLSWKQVNLESMETEKSKERWPSALTSSLGSKFGLKIDYKFAENYFL